MQRWKLVGAGVLLLAAAGLAWHGMPSAGERAVKQSPALEAKLQSEEVRIDPGELYDLTQNNQIRLVLLDMRSEADFNQFHLVDAQRLELDQLEQPWLLHLPPEAVVVVMSNDEARAELGWKLLAAQGVANLYLLGGGVNFWLDVYRDGRYDAVMPPRVSGNDHLRHVFTSALGENQPAAHPDPRHTPKRTFTAKVKSASAAKRPSGGCG